MVASATLFKQANYSDEDTLILSRVAELYKNVADAQIDSATSSSFVISQMKAFNIEASDAISIVDKVNEVSNKFAVSSTDISAGLTKSSASLVTYGNSIDEVIGLVSAGTELLTGQARRVANGLISISANISKMAKTSGELEYKVDGVTKKIDLFDKSTGEMRNTYQVLEEVSKGWDKMSTAEQTALGLSVAGKTQYAVFASTMSNFETAIKASETALNSQGSAVKENERYMESMSAQLNLLKSTIQEIILGNGGLESFGRTILKIANAIATFLKETKGIQVSLTALSLVMGLKLVTSFISFGQTLLANIGTMALFTAETGSLSAGLKAVGVSASVAQIGIGALIAVVSLGVMAWNKYKASQEEAFAKRQATITSLKSEVENLKSVKTQLQNESLTRDELNVAVDKNLSSYSDEISKIEDLNEARQASIDKIDAEIKKKAEQTKNTGLTDYQSAISGNTDINFSMDKTHTRSGFEENAKEIKEAKGNLEALTKALENYKKKLVEANGNLDESSMSYKYNKSQMEKVEDKLSDLYAEQKANEEVVINFEQALSVLGQKYDEVSGQIVDMTDSDIEAYEAQKNLADSTEESISSYEDLEKTIERINTAYSESLNNLGGMEDAYRTLAESVNEYAQTGEFSLGTLEDLLSLGSDYLSLLEYEDGQFTINQAGLENLANARIDEAESIAYQKAMAELAKLANEDLTTAVDNASDSSIDSYDANMTAVDGLEKAKEAAYAGAKAWDAYASAMTQSVVDTGADKSKVDEVMNGLKNELLVLKDARDSIGSYTKEVDKEIKTSNNSTKAKKASTKASKDKETQLDKEIKKIKEHIKALKDESSALKDNISDYETAISYIIDSTNKKIEQLETKREKALNKILIQAQKIAGTYEKELTGVKAVKAEL